MAKEMTDAQMLRKLKSDIKVLVKRHEEAIAQRDNLVEALQWIISLFCPGPDWSTIPARINADAAIAYAQDGDA